MRKTRYMIDIFCHDTHDEYYFSKNDMLILEYTDKINLCQDATKYDAFPTKKNALKAVPFVKKLLEKEQGHFSIHVVKYDW